MVVVVDEMLVHHRVTPLPLQHWIHQYLGGESHCASKVSRTQQMTRNWTLTSQSGVQDTFPIRPLADMYRTDFS